MAYNDLDGVKALMEECGDEIAAIMLEPIACNMGMVKPLPGFLEGLRELCDKYGSVLFFDEVITGFRVGLGGAQELYGVMPDMSAFGKVIGSGLPVGAYGGRTEIMDWVAPSGPVYQAGTLSGNPLAMAAGKAAFDQLAAPGFYEALEEKERSLKDWYVLSWKNMANPHTSSVKARSFTCGLRRRLRMRPGATPRLRPARLNDTVNSSGSS